MANREVKLLSLWVSPFARRVEWALKLKGVDYEYIEALKLKDVDHEYIEEGSFNKSSLLLELNPVTKKVPVLVHDGKVILESYIILEYIDETWKQNPLLPQDPYERAQARFWAKFAEEKVLDVAWTALCSLGEEKEKAEKLAIEAVEKIEELIKGKKFFGGESIGYLDIALGWIAHWLPIWEEVASVHIVDPLKFPATTAWVKNFLNHGVIKDNLPERERMLVYFHERRKTLSSIPHP